MTKRANDSPTIIKTVEEIMEREKERFKESSSAERERSAAGESSREADPLSALCFSGGGMRSATFCLGFLRGFRELLPQFHYLSTVSGGGYAGAWVANLVRKHGWKHVIQKILDPSVQNPAEITHLRRYSDLIETRSWFSTATFRLVSAYLRSLTIWWLLYLPILLLVALVPWILAIAQQWLQSGSGWMIATFVFIVCGAVAVRKIGRLGSPHHPKYKSRLGVAVTSLVAATFFASMVRGFPFHLLSDQMAQSNLIFATRFVPDLILWLAATGICVILGKPSLIHIGPQKRIPGEILGALALSLGWATANMALNQLVAVHRMLPVYPLTVSLFGVAAWLTAAIVVGRQGRHLDDSDREMASDLIGTAATVCTVGAGACALALGTTWLIGLLDSSVQSVLAGATIGGVITAVLSFQSEVGQRMPAGWRRYASHLAMLMALLFGATLWLGASLAWTAIEPRLLDVLSSSSVPQPDIIWAPIIGMVALLFWSWWWSRTIGVNAFSLNGLYRVRLVRAFLTGDTSKVDPPLVADPQTPAKPLHLINTVVNDSGTSRLEWRDRRAASFVLSPLYCGSEATRFVPTNQFADGAMTMGRAIAISGAAANPSMGHFSSRPVQWLMGFFNLRLGWWLSNPRYRLPGQRKASLNGEPRHAIGPYGEELFGRPGVNSKFLNLSDGGHFENLGLYEVVRRKCKYIVAVDASHDPTRSHEDLSRAERLVRIDFGAELEWQPSPDVGHYRVARIHYQDGSEGRLVYVKPELTGNEPADVLAYAEQAKDRGEFFPHQSTSDLWFDEAQFESYMKLGQHSAETILKDMRALAAPGDHLFVAGIAALTAPLDDVRTAEGKGITSDPVLHPIDPIESLASATPALNAAAPEQPWWRPLVKPVVASVLATTTVLGVTNLIYRRSLFRQTDTVTASRVTTVIERRQRSFLLPWFEEFRPTPLEVKDLMAIKELPLIQAKLGADSLKLMNEGKTDTRYLGAPLRPADVDRISTLATLLIPDCQPITVRGLSSSSQIDIPNASAFPWQVDESNECGNRSDCLNTRLANRRADLIAHLLSSANVLVTVKHWAEKDYSLLVDAQFDDLDPPTDPAADPEAKKKAVANRYIIPRGVLNRSVEIIPEGKSCDFDRIQRRLAIMLLERPY